MWNTYIFSLPQSERFWLHISYILEECHCHHHCMEVVTAAMFCVELSAAGVCYICSEHVYQIGPFLILGHYSI